MAIEIIPKPPKKVPFRLNILSYISIGLLVSTILSYFLLDYFQKNVNQDLEEITASFLVPRTPQEQELEGSIVQYQRKINDFVLIFNRHQTNSSFFTFLEEITHPNVIFSQFDLTKPSVSLSGTAENFVVLGQQLLIFQNNSKILKTNLSTISLGEEGRIGFTFNLTLLPKTFEFK